MVSSTTKMAPDWLTSGAFEYSLVPSWGATTGVCGETKDSMVRGLPASCSEKSVCFRSRTGEPSLPVTLTVRRTLSCANPGRTSDKHKERRRTKRQMNISDSIDVYNVPAGD